jgi:hypothetical protein
MCRRQNSYRRALGLVTPIQNALEPVNIAERDFRRFLGEPHERESTVCDVDAYNGVSAYLDGLQEPPIKTVEDILAFNSKHAAAEGANPGDNPGFASGQVSQPSET